MWATGAFKKDIPKYFEKWIKEDYKSPYNHAFINMLTWALKENVKGHLEHPWEREIE